MSTNVDAEILGRRTVLRDLVALSAIPAAWVGRGPLAVAGGLAETLIGLLHLDFVSVRLRDPRVDEAVEATRGDAWNGFPEWMETYLASLGRHSELEVVPDVDSAQRYRGVVLPIGLNAGVVAAASDRSDFPTVTEQLLLRLTANQAATAFQNACLIDERARAEEELRKARNELGVRVAEQTAEQSALRRVATLVARGVAPEEVFAAVTEEVGQLLSAEYAVLLGYEPEGTMTVMASFARTGDRVPVGRQWSLGGKNITTLVFETGRPARIDSYADTSGAVSVTARKYGVGSGIGTPVIVEGHPWGVMGIYSRLGQPLPAHTEARLASFTELLATAIANAESRAELAQLAEEQAGLRRVATLVARGVPPEELFAAVVSEVDQLLGVDMASICRYEDDGTVTFVAAWGRAFEHFPVGSRQMLGGKNVGTIVFETGRSARIDNYADVSSGQIGIGAHEAGLNSSLAAPIMVEGRLWGAIAAGSIKKQPLPADTEARLASFTELLATAIANAESRAELTASRARIVAAADDTRQRIERDLHDGAQQQLVTLGLKLRSLDSTIPPEFDGLHTHVGEVALGLEDVLDELRELSRGIHPAVLSRGGLVPALKTLAHRAPIPVELDVHLSARPSERTEVAVYYVIAEALTNVAKHARASVVEIEVEALDGDIRVSVSDDGIGGADPSRGSGLLGLRDRVDALGAAMTITSSPGEGTSIIVHFPETS
jgi:signal transduction histidine kinase